MVQIMNLPDFGAAAEQGQLDGRERREYNRTEKNREEIESLAPQIMAGDRDAYTRGAVIDKDRADEYQSEHVKRLKQLAAAGQYMKDALASKDPLRIQAAWTSGVRPLLGSIVKDKPIPEAWTDDMMPAMEQAMAMVQGVQTEGLGGRVQSRFTNDKGDVIALMADGSKVMTGEKAAPNIKILEQEGQVPTGYVTSGGQAGAAVPLGAGGAPAPTATAAPSATVPGANPNEPIVMEAANAMIAAGVPEAQVDAFVQAQLSKGATVQPPAGNSLQTPQIVTGGPARTPTSAEKKAAETAATGTMRTLTPDEVASQGLPEGTFAQVNALTGEVKVGGNNAQRQPGELTAAQKLKLKKDGAKAKGALAGTMIDLDRMADAVRDLKTKKVGLEKITGLQGMFPNIPGGDAANAQADLDALKSQIGFAVLQNMRLMSPTGGSLGNVSNEEGARLERNLASLDTAQSYEQLQERLDKIIEYVTDSKARLNTAYDEQFGEAENYEPEAEAPATPGGWSMQRVD